MILVIRRTSLVLRYHLSLLVHLLAKCKRDIQRLMVPQAILCECPKD